MRTANKISLLRQEERGCSLPMMAGYHDAHSTPANNPSLYRYPDPPGHHPPPPSLSNYSHDGLPRVQPTNGNGNGTRQAQDPYSTSTSTGLGALSDSQPQQHQHQRQPSLGTLLQYNNAPPPHHRRESSPAAGHTSANATPAPTAAKSPVNKKNTRIPRACDLCSQRKVKVCHSPAGATQTEQD